jgi:hypothetical protein
MRARKSFGRLLSCLGTLLPLVVLAGCLQSKTLLLGESDFVQPLPDEFTVFGYTQTDGAYTLNVEENGAPKKVHFTRSGAGYQPADEKGVMYFARSGGENSYLVAISDTAGVFYGFVELRDQVMVSRFVSSDPGKALETIRSSAGEASEVVEGLQVENGALLIPGTDALHLISDLVQKGELVLQGGPFYWLPGHVDGTDPATAPPAKLDAEGNVVNDG